MGRREDDLIEEAQRVLALEVEEQGQNSTEELQAEPQREEEKPDRMSIQAPSGRLDPRVTPELIEKRSAALEAQQKMPAFQNEIRDRLLDQKSAEMGARGWILADVFRRLYDDGSSIDVCIFVETAAQAVESGTPCEHRRVSNEEYIAVETRKWEEANRHLAALANVPGMDQDQIMEARIAAGGRVPKEALEEIISAQEEEGWRFTSIVNKSFVFVRNVQ